MARDAGSGYGVLPGEPNGHNPTDFPKPMPGPKEKWGWPNGHDDGSGSSPIPVYGGVPGGGHMPGGAGGDWRSQFDAYRAQLNGWLATRPTDATQLRAWMQNRPQLTRPTVPTPVAAPVATLPTTVPAYVPPPAVVHGWGVG